MHFVGNHSMHVVYWKIPFPLCWFAWKQAHSPTDVTSQKAWEKQHIQVAFVALFLPNTEVWTKAVEPSQRAKRRQSHSEAEWITEGAHSEQVRSHNEGVNSKWGKMTTTYYYILCTNVIQKLTFEFAPLAVFGTSTQLVVYRGQFTRICASRVCVPISSHAHRHKHTYSDPSRDLLFKAVNGEDGMQVDGFPIWVVLIGSVYPRLNHEPWLSRRATTLPSSHRTPSHI